MSAYKRVVSCDSFYGTRHGACSDTANKSVPYKRVMSCKDSFHCAPYRELIELALSRGRNAMAIWQDLVDEHGFPARYASVRRFVVKLRGQRTPDAHPVITTAPGEEGQVDYGEGPMVRHPGTGKYRRTRLFVFTLGFSRKSVRLLTFASSAQRWAALHEETFRRLGGTVDVVVLDNLKEGVLTPDVYDPTLNPLYRDVLAHYGVVALPCRVGAPTSSSGLTRTVSPCGRCSWCPPTTARRSQSRHHTPCASVPSPLRPMEFHP